MKKDRIKFYYPGFKSRAVTFSYDDGPIDSDGFLIKILDRYRLKGTFNLVAKDCFHKERLHLEWEHIGQPVCYNCLARSEIYEIYRAHEVACHGYEHLSLKSIEDDEAAVDREIGESAEVLREIFGRNIRGFAYPGGTFNEISDKTAGLLSARGYEYARNTFETRGFSLPEDFLFWRPTCHDNDGNIGEILQAFLQTDEELALLYIWGHGYEMSKPDRNGYENFEKICKTCQSDDIWGATNLEICRYVKSVRKVRITDEEIFNASDETVFLKYGERKFVLSGGEKIRLF